MQGEWIRKPQGEASAIFVHGILSSGDTAWRYDKRTYWPELLDNHPQLTPLGIYVYTYQTGIFSGSYSISDIVDDLKERMKLDGVLKCKRLIFVCHSMGGIVVRKYIVERQLDLIEAGKEVDLFLVASPSLGSKYADWLYPLARFLGHTQADALRVVKNNTWLKNLDKEFFNLKEGGKLTITGKELLEDKLVYLRGFWGIWGGQVVDRLEGMRYFGESFTVPGSDHFSIAKPINKTADQHRLLSKFIEDAISPGTEVRNGARENQSASRVRPRWPNEPTPFEPGLADLIAVWRKIQELMTMLEVEAVAKRKRILMLKGPSGWSKSSLLAEAKRYAVNLGVPTAHVDFHATILRDPKEFLKTLQVGLDSVLPNFAAAKDPDYSMLLDDLRHLSGPLLILLDTYENISETKELVTWIESTLLTMVEDKKCNQLRFLIGGKQVATYPRAVRLADEIELVEINDIQAWTQAWKEWAQQNNLPVDDKNIERTVKAYQGRPSDISSFLETAAAMLHPTA